MFSKIFFALAIFGLAKASVRPATTVLARIENPNPSYSFAYDVQDAVTGDSKNHLENRNGDVVTGEYSLNDPDGTRRTVQYRADPINGFVATVQKQPLVTPQVVAQEPAAVQQPFAAVEQQFSFVQQPVSLVQERFYVPQQPVQQALFVAQPRVPQQAAFIAQQPARPVQQPTRLAQQPARLAQNPASQKQQVDESEPTTTVEYEDVEPTTESPIADNGGYYYPKPPSASSAKAILFGRKEEKSAPKAAPKSDKLELVPEEPQAETFKPVAAGNAGQPKVAVQPVARVSAPVFTSPFIQAPVFGFSSPFTYSTVTVF